jgi:hypothetical protein
MRRRWDVNRSFWFWGFDCVPSFSSGEVVSKRARVQSRSSEREPKGNLDGFLARLHAFPQNEGKAGRQNNQVCKESSCHEGGMGENVKFRVVGHSESTA